MVRVSEFFVLLVLLMSSGQRLDPQAAPRPTEPSHMERDREIQELAEMVRQLQIDIKSSQRSFANIKPIPSRFAKMKVRQGELDVRLNLTVIRQRQLELGFSQLQQELEGRVDGLDSRQNETAGRQHEMTSTLSQLHQQFVTRWKTIDGSLKFVSVGSKGVWGVDHSNDIFYRTGTVENTAALGSDWVGVDGKLKQISSGHSVWGVSTSDYIYIRQGITDSNPTGTGWGMVAGGLMQVDVSSTANQVWGVNSGHRIYRRIGITASRPAGSTWQNIGGGLKFVSVGPSGVWGVNRNNDVFYRLGTFGNEASAGSGWRHIVGKMKQISSGDSVVWAVSADNDIFIREGVHASTPTGTAWRQIRGKLQQVEAAPRAFQVWAVNSTGNILQIERGRT